MANSIITHPFTSGQPDGSDPTQVQPSNWNAQHLITTPDGLGAGKTGLLTGTDVSGVLGINAIQSSGALKYFRRNAADSAFEFIKDKVNFSPDFNFSGVAISQSLTAGIGNTVTLPRGFVGISGAYTNSYVYITDGNAGNEAVKITGGSATDGVVGTLSFTPTKNHTSGNWTLGSASGGIQEALNNLPSGVGTVVLDPTAMVDVHARLYVPAQRNCIDGINFFNIAVRRASDYPSGDLFYFPTGSVSTIKNFTITNEYGTGTGGLVPNTGGAALSGFQANLAIDHIFIYNGYNALKIDSCYQVIADEFNFNVGASATCLAAIWLGSTVSTNNNCQFNGGALGLTDKIDGFFIQSVDGLQVTNMNVGGGHRQVYLSPTTGNVCGNIQFSNCFFDAGSLNCVKMDGQSGSTFNNIQFDQCHMVGQYVSTNTYGVDICYTNLAPSLTAIRITNCTISAWMKDGIAIGTFGNPAPNLVIIANNFILGNNASDTANHGGILLENGANGIKVCGNIIGNYGISTAGRQYWAIATTLNISDCTFQDNDCRDNITGAIAIYGTTAKCAITGNLCDPIGFQGTKKAGTLTTAAVYIQTPSGIASTVIANNGNMTLIAAGSGASFPFPDVDDRGIVNITGVNGITSVSHLRTGQFGTIVTSDGAVTFTAGGTIGTTLTTVQKVPVSFYFDGTKIYLK